MQELTNTDFMTPYEQRLYLKCSKTKGDKAKDGKILKNAVSRVLGIETEQTLDDGSIVNLSIAERLAIKKLAYLDEHPEKIDLRELSAVLGEQKLEVETTISAGDMFKGIASVE